MTLEPRNIIADSPPQPIEVCPEGIPVELKKRPQWSNWKYTWNGKKWTKHPYDPRSGRKASSTDLMTWRGFEEAVAALKIRKYDGVGFAFCSADPFVGIDLDECRDPETGKIEEWAQQILERFEDVVHVEVSPSGEGVHLITSTGTGNKQNGDLNHRIQAVSFSGRAKPVPREWIVDNHVWKGHAATWYGEGGVAKSLLALHLSMTVSAESQNYWMGFAVKTVPVLYVDFELDADEQHRRALQLCAGMSLPQVPQGFHYLSAAGLPPVNAFEVAAEECERLGVGLTIVDSVGFALEGDSELSRDVLGFYRECLQPLKGVGAVLCYSTIRRSL